MKRTRQILTLAIGLMTLMAVSCRKADYKASNEVPVVDNSAIIGGLNMMRATPQVINVTAGVYTEVRLAQGTKLKFYPYSFKDQKGNILSSGTVQITVTEVYGAGAGIVNRLAMMSGNQLLKNGGQIYITGQMNGSEVAVNKYGICFLAPTHSEQPMALYYGTGGYEDSMTRWMRVGNMAGTAVTGTVLDTQSVYYVDTSGMGVDTANIYRNYNEFDSVSSWNWIGCNYPFAPGNTLTDVTVTPASTNFNNTNTAVFLVIPEARTVIPVTDYNKITHSFSMPPGYDVPSDVTAHLIVLSYQNGRLYYFQQLNFNLAFGMEFTPDLREYTPNEILNMLYAL